MMKKDSNLDKPINIHNIGTEIDLIAKDYRVYVLSGWGVDLGNFSIVFKDKETGEQIQSRKAIYPVQAFWNGKRIKKIFTIKIKRKSSYEVIFENPNSLKVKRSNLIFYTLFKKPIPNEKIEILITKQSGLFLQ